MPLSRVNLTGSNSSNTSITSPSANTILMKAGNINAMQIAWDPTASGNTYYKFSGASSAFASRPTGGTPEYDFANGRLRINNYTTLARGPNNNDGLFFNVVPSLDGTVYYPQYTGSSGAGSLFIGMPSGGNGGMSIRTYRHGTSTSTYNESTMTQIAAADDSGFTAIKFAASQTASSDPNTLDDYEEGTWTPSIVQSGGSGTVGTYNTRDGRYVKIGKLVWAWFYIGFTKGTLSGGQLLVTDYPFVCDSAGAQYPGAGLSYWSGLGTAQSYMSGYIRSNTNSLELHTSSGAVTTHTTASANILGSTSEFILGVHYQTAS